MTTRKEMTVVEPMTTGVLVKRNYIQVYKYSKSHFEDLIKNCWNISAAPLIQMESFQLPEIVIGLHFFSIERSMLQEGGVFISPNIYLYKNSVQ